MPDFKELIERIAVNEGFRSKVYKCSEGVDTIGHGFTWLSEEESLHILKGRVSKLHLSLSESIDWYDNLPGAVQGVVIEMCFQIGKSGMLKFKKMIANMKAEKWPEAAEEMKDSLWYRQTPQRCGRLADIVASQ